MSEQPPWAKMLREGGAIVAAPDVFAKLTDSLYRDAAGTPLRVHAMPCSALERGQAYVIAGKVLDPPAMRFQPTWLDPEPMTMMDFYRVRLVREPMGTRVILASLDWSSPAKPRSGSRRQEKREAVREALLARRKRMAKRRAG